MSDIKAGVGMTGHLGIVVTRARPTLRSRIGDFLAALVRRIR